MPPESRAEFIDGLPPEIVIKLYYEWDIWARDNQRLPKESFFAWVIIAGRGSGKTRTGAEAVKTWAKEARDAKKPIRIHILGQNSGDNRDTLVEGESGILAVSSPDFYPLYEPSKRRLTWPDGTIGLLFAGDEPDQLRGPQCHKAWVDELAKFKYPQESWDNLELGLRLGDNPQVIVTTTPRPLPIIRSLMRDPMNIVTTGSSYENMHNLAPSYIKRIIKKFEGTRLGLQELHAKVLDDIQGSLFPAALVERNRAGKPMLEDIVRVVVAVDPAVTSNDSESDETGITVLCLALNRNMNRLECYLLRDASGVMPPNQWANMACKLMKDYKGDRIVAERNNGGDLVEINIRTVNAYISYKSVWASRGKTARAEPISSLLEQDRIKFVGQYPELENQLAGFTNQKYVGEGSPDRAESFMWGVWELMMGEHGEYDPDKWDDIQQ